MRVDNDSESLFYVCTNSCCCLLIRSEKQLFILTFSSIYLK